jgi:transcriptional regulator with XRE-family HTH domain
MDESWRDLREVWERIRWARIHLTEWDRPTDAAKSLGIRPGTYRTYEHSKADGGRQPPIDELATIAKKYKVNFAWLATGDGHPHASILADPRLSVIATKTANVPAEKQDDALAAAAAVLDAFARKAG